MCAYTALHLAAREGHNGIIDMLLDHGALNDGFCRWFYNCRSPRSLWQILVDPELDPWAHGHDHAGTRHGDWRSKTPLHIAICSSRIDTAKLLVSRGAGVARSFDVLSLPAHGALHQAATAGFTGLVQYILDTHPELPVDKPDENGLTAFYHAYANQRWDSTAPYSLVRGANINITSRIIGDDESLKTTPLGEACRLGRFEDAHELIDMGADVSFGILREATEEDDSELEDDFDSDTHISLLHVCSMDFSRDNDLYPRKPGVWHPVSSQRSSQSALIARLVTEGLSLNSQWGKTESAACRGTTLRYPMTRRSPSP
ncbi:ankyrin [Parathielavia appendiculata]|uniref:Ankyrin n=1 Tax=Parathielavia appendiculata TaxID=2587402 RepID=A0AAN6TUW7_9PEZI|nr:ankyrin [Parathielavia appendiculata]